MQAFLPRGGWRQVLLALAGSALALAARAQPAPGVWGRNDRRDLTAAPFAADTTAAAVGLCDYGTASIVSDNARPPAAALRPRNTHQTSAQGWPELGQWGEQLHQLLAKQAEQRIIKNQGGAGMPPHVGALSPCLPTSFP